MEEVSTTTTSMKENVDWVKNLPPSLKSVNELFGLSEALSIFKRRFCELQKHMEYIDQSIDIMYKQQCHQESEVVVPGPNVSSSSSLAASTLSSAVQRIENSGKCMTFDERFQFFCETMASRDLRRYITVNMSDLEMLREVATTAFKRAPDPAKLVLSSIGRFYVQGRKAFTEGSPLIANRKACLLILEFFLLIDCTHIEPSIKEEAEAAAIAWRNRLMNEGGLSKACNEDARGLLLLIAAYGIPSVCGNQNLIELIRLSNVKEISNALRRSPTLVKKIPVIIRGMVNQRVSCVAVDVAYAFGLEEQFPPEILLSTFLKDSQGSWERLKRKSRNSPLALKQANEKQLGSFKAVKKCLEDNKIDPSKLPGWNIDTNIVNLENDISKLGKVIEEQGNNLKRKAETTRFVSPELKHPRSSNGVLPHMHHHPDFMEQRGIVREDDLLHLVRQHGPGAYLGDRPLAHNFPGVPTYQSSGLFDPSPSGIGQGYLGLVGTSVGFGNRDSGADLYQFADAVLDGESRANAQIRR